MAKWLDDIVKEERLFLPGNSACAGCGPAINMQHFLGALKAEDPAAKIFLVIPASCWTILTGIWPRSAFLVNAYMALFASAAAEAAGIRAALDLKGVEHAYVVVWGGDGSTYDIGFAGVSAAAERNEDIIYVLNDNEAYMNTGVQKSGATPEGAWTTTTPAGAPREGAKKDIDLIITEHKAVPYLATLAIGSVPLLRDFREKVAKATRIKGFRFLHMLGSCPPGWKFKTSESVEVVRLAIESCYFPLFEYAEGKLRISYRPKKFVPVRDFLQTQGRFAHLGEDGAAKLQEAVEARWEELLSRAVS